MTSIESAQHIHLSTPDIGEEEIKSVTRALKSGWIAPAGPELHAFETDLAALAGRRHAVALSSGTAALHLALLAIGVKPGDAVVTSTMTFAATANAIMYTRAEPVFIDCDKETGNIDPNLLKDALIDLKARGRDVAAILPVDLLGKAADYSSIVPLASEHGIPVVADAAEALGASHNGSPAGSFGQSAAFSFNGNKVITTSGGGAYVTDDADAAAIVRYLSTQAREPVLHYEHREVGYNYRLSNILAALGRAQLGRLDEMIARRRRIRSVYKDLFEALPGVGVFQADGDAEDNCWLSAIIVDPDTAGWRPNSLAEHLDRNYIESRPLWKPMHRQPVFRTADAYVNGSADYLFEHGLTLPSGSGLSDSQIARITSCIEEFLHS